jgi:hypothetical protein
MAFRFFMDVSALEARGPVAGDSGSSAIGESTGRERPSCMKPTASRARNVALADDPSSSPSNITTAPAAGRRAGRTRRQSDDGRS